MRFRQMVVAVVHVIVTAGQYIGQASETSTTREVPETAEGTVTSATANHGETESRRFLIRGFKYWEISKPAHSPPPTCWNVGNIARRFQSVFE
jgi:hypothetical protein